LLARIILINARCLVCRVHASNNPQVGHNNGKMRRVSSNSTAELANPGHQTNMSALFITLDELIGVMMLYNTGAVISVLGSERFVLTVYTHDVTLLETRRRVVPSVR